jgi:hypothetical protein
MSACGERAERAKPAGPETAYTPATEAAPQDVPEPEAGGGSARDWSAPGPDPVDGSSWIVPPPFYAAGDEPYWRLELADGWFVFRRSGLPEIEAPIVAPSARGGGEVFQSPPLEFVVRTGSCSTDGGPGDAFATVVFDGAEYEGCVFRGQVANGSPEAASVSESIQQIDACLARLGQPAVVTSIYPREDKRTALTLQQRNGGLFECAVEQGGEIAFLDPIERASVGGAGTRIRFLREGSAPDPGCEGEEEIRDSANVLLGRLLPGRCQF